MLNPRHYNRAIDVWSLGVIFGDMLGREQLFTGGNGFIDQLKQIVELVGSPNEDELDEWVADENARSFLLNALPPVRFLRLD